MTQTQETIRDLMTKCKLHPQSIQQFLSFFETLQNQKSPFMSFSDIKPLPCSQTVQLHELDFSKDKAAPQHCAILKLNGGLGTSMGCFEPKSSLQIKGKDTFLDIIACLHHQKNPKTPLLFMNSFKSAKKTREILSKYSQLDIEHFMQNKVPRLLSGSLEPAQFKHDEDNWCPAGHGDVYFSLYQHGFIDTLIHKGISYLFISNADNLGAQFDYRILNYMQESNSDFLMECTPKLEMDKKGGVVCHYKGSSHLVEIAQVKPSDLETFYDTKTFSSFNTNNIWIYLPKLKELLENNRLKTQLIVNKKTHQNQEIIQLESAMGSAISCFDCAKVLIVDRSRFLPVKTTSDLLYLRSDAITWEHNCLQAHRKIPTQISLSHHYKHVNDLNHFIGEPLGLKDCDRLTIEGPFQFGSKLSFGGEVTLKNESEECIKLASNSHFEDVKLPFSSHKQRTR